MSIVVQAPALKIKNKGGGHDQKKGKRDTGTDYVTFICPSCQHRNNQPIYRADYGKGNYLSFRCKMCRITVEVLRPVLEKKVELQKSRSLIITPEEYEREKNGNRQPVLG